MTRWTSELSASLLFRQKCLKICLFVGKRDQSVQLHCRNPQKANHCAKQCHLTYTDCKNRCRGTWLWGDEIPKQTSRSTLYAGVGQKRVIEFLVQYVTQW